MIFGIIDFLVKFLFWTGFLIEIKIKAHLKQWEPGLVL